MLTWPGALLSGSRDSQQCSHRCWKCSSLLLAGASDKNRRRPEGARLPFGWCLHARPFHLGPGRALRAGCSCIDTFNEDAVQTSSTPSELIGSSYIHDSANETPNSTAHSKESAVRTLVWILQCHADPQPQTPLLKTLPTPLSVQVRRFLASTAE